MCIWFPFISFATEQCLETRSNRNTGCSTDIKILEKAEKVGVEEMKDCESSTDRGRGRERGQKKREA